jgi:hypothetical protein
MTRLTPLRFIGEPIEVQFDEPPALEKAPPCPSAFTWAATPYRVIALLAEWRDYGRRGRMARNMRPEHAQRAALKGSWGVGRFYFRVRAVSPETLAAGGQIFELYYDRAPQDADHRKGGWFLKSELVEE